MPEKIITIESDGIWYWGVGEYEKSMSCPFAKNGKPCGDWCPHFSVEEGVYQEFGKPLETIQDYIKLTCGSGRRIDGTIIDERWKE